MNGPETVQYSARLTARIRMAEAARAQPLFVDPLAPFFGGGDAVTSSFDHTHFIFRRMASQFKRDFPTLGSTRAGPDIDPSFFCAYTAFSRRLRRRRADLPHIPVRTRIFDAVATRWLMEVHTADPAAHAQIVMLGAGFDSRAYRLPAFAGPAPPDASSPSAQPATETQSSADADSATPTSAPRAPVTVFEVDQPDVLAYKRSVLSAHRAFITPLAPVVSVRADFATRAGVSDIIVNVRWRARDREAAAAAAAATAAAATAAGDTTTAASITAQDAAAAAVAAAFATDVSVPAGLRSVSVHYGSGPDLVPAFLALVSAAAPDADMAAGDAAPADAGVALSRAWWLLSLLYRGYDPAAPTLFLAEGLLMYLRPCNNAELLPIAARLSEGHPRSAFLADIYSAHASLSGASYYDLFKSGTDREDISSAVLPRFTHMKAAVMAPARFELYCSGSGSASSGTLAGASTRRRIATTPVAAAAASPAATVLVGAGVDAGASLDVHAYRRRVAAARARLVPDAALPDLAAFLDSPWVRTPTWTPAAARPGSIDFCVSEALAAAVGTLGAGATPTRQASDGVGSATAAAPVAASAAASADDGVCAVCAGTGAKCARAGVVPVHRLALGRVRRRREVYNAEDSESEPDTARSTGKGCGNADVDKDDDDDDDHLDWDVSANGDGESASAVACAGSADTCAPGVGAESVDAAVDADVPRWVPTRFRAAFDHSLTLPSSPDKAISGGGVVAAGVGDAGVGEVIEARDECIFAQHRSRCPKLWQRTRKEYDFVALLRREAARRRRRSLAPVDDASTEADAATPTVTTAATAASWSAATVDSLADRVAAAAGAGSDSDAMCNCKALMKRVECMVLWLRP